MAKTLLTRSAGIVVMTALLLLAIGASQASAATSYVPSGSFGNGAGGAPSAEDGMFDRPKRVAVDHDNGHVYVVDADNDRIQVFAVDGSSASYLTEITGLDDPYGVAIDQSASPISVYVSDAGNNRVLKLDSDGAATPAFTPDAGFGVAQGTGATRVGDFHADVEVDPSTGELLVADPADDVIQRYAAADGSFVDAFNGAGSPDGSFTGLEDVATDGAHVYAVDSRGGPATDGNPSRTEQFSAGGAHEQTLRPLQAEGDGLVAVDPGTSNLLVGDVRFFSPRVHVFDGATHLTSINVPSTAQLTGLAVDGATTGRLYAAGDDPFCDGACGEIGVKVLEPAESRT